MMGDLVNDRADIGLGAIHITGDRMIDVDFTVPFYEFQGRVLHSHWSRSVEAVL